MIMVNKKFPLISIVTVSWNSQNCIEDTIKSVLMQDYPNVEYIVVDGASTDDTLQIIKKYADRITYFCSEPDNGVYDAMNKGISLAKGDWIIYMNCGDKFYDTNVVTTVFVQNEGLINQSVKVIYGDTIKVFKHGQTKIEKGNPVEVIKKFQPFIHQSAFFNIKNKNDAFFDCKYKIASDYNTTVRYFKKYGEISFLYIPTVVSVYEASDGLSARKENELKLLREYIRIKLSLNGFWLEALKDEMKYVLKCLKVHKRLQ